MIRFKIIISEWNVILFIQTLLESIYRAINNVSSSNKITAINALATSGFGNKQKSPNTFQLYLIMFKYQTGGKKKLLTKIKGKKKNNQIP